MEHYSVFLHYEYSTFINYTFLTLSIPIVEYNNEDTFYEKRRNWIKLHTENFIRFDQLLNVFFIIFLCINWFIGNIGRSTVWDKTEATMNIISSLICQYKRRITYHSFSHFFSSKFSIMLSLIANTKWPY